MFDRQALVFVDAGSRTQHTTSTKTVIEKRAPTDESVRLLREMEAAVEKKFLSQFKVEQNTGFSARVVIASDPMNFQLVYHLLFALNGKEQHVQVRVNSVATQEECVAALAKGVSEYVTREILVTAFAGIKHPINQPNY
jgi:5-enolpyruvylshikimate-3-phosphate synthase